MKNGRRNIKSGVKPPNGFPNGLFMIYWLLEAGSMAGYGTDFLLLRKLQETEREESNVQLPLVSIIVPIHNSEKTLNRCIDSILNQDYQELEVFLVDDGSGDGSLAICRDYAKRDARVKVIRKEQSGVSDARNLAMDQAEGKYLQFVDSDDWITTDATRMMVSAAEYGSCDMVITHFFRVNHNKIRRKGHIKEYEIMTRKGFAEHMMEKPANFYYGVMWNKLYRRDILNAYKLRCSRELNWCEDFLFNLQYLCYAERICALPYPTYYYVKTKNSLVAKEATMKNTIQTKKFIFTYYKELYENIDLYEENKGKINRFLVSIASDGH